MLLKIKFAFLYLLYIKRYWLYRVLHKDHAEEYLVENAKYPRIALKVLGIPVGINCRIRNGLMLYNYNKGNLSIGDNVHIGKAVLLDLKEKITIADNCTISMGSKILTHQNLGSSELASKYPKTSGPINIEENVYIGANCIVLHTATKLAPKTLLAANSTLDKTTENNSVYAGNPATIKKKISE